MKWTYFKENMNSILFSGISWITSIFCLVISIRRINLDKLDEIHWIIWCFFLAGIFFLFLPFFKKVKIGKFLELERDIRNAKEDMNSFKSEVRQNFTLLSTNISTISAINNQIQINIPGVIDLQNAIKTLETQSSNQIQASSQAIKNELSIEDDDIRVVLTNARIQIEFLLRTILGKGIVLKNVDKEVKYLTLTQLIRDFLEKYPQYRYLENSLIYVRRFANAASHAQLIPEFQAKEALEMSSKVIGILQYINDEKVKNG